MQDYHLKENESPVLSKVTEKVDTNEFPDTAENNTMKIVKTSKTFVKNNTEYATVKTTKVWVWVWHLPTQILINILGIHCSRVL